MKRWLLISWFFLFTLFPNLLFADTIVVQGEVMGAWDADTVLVVDNININEGESLFIQPGSLIQFQGHFSLKVEGTIHATGSSEAPIVFTVNDTTGFTYDSIPDGGWYGIRFSYTNQIMDSSIFEYCNFYYGKAVPGFSTKEIIKVSDSCGSAIYITGFDKIRISHCRFENNYARLNGGAVYLDSANIIIKDCYFLNNRCGMTVEPWGYGGAVCSDNAQPLIWNSYFEGNQSTGVGGGAAIRFKDARIGNCTFNGNHSALGGAFGFLHIQSVDQTNCNNLIYNNTAAFFGGGIANLNASPVYLNHTIVNNQAMYGGAFYCKDEVDPDLFNCILWGNTAWSGFGPEVYLFEPYSQANFYFCDVAGGPELFDGSGGGAGFTGQFYESIDQDPQFQLTGEYPYALLTNSPAINTGVPDTTGMNFPAIDLIGMPRVLQGRIDMGAYESAVVGLPNFEDISDINLLCYPNPASELLAISYFLPNPRIVKLELMDVTGRKIKTIENGFKNTGYHNISFDVSSLSEGVYFCSITIETHLANCKIIVY